MKILLWFKISVRWLRFIENVTSTFYIQPILLFKIAQLSWLSAMQYACWINLLIIYIDKNELNM